MVSDRIRRTRCFPLIPRRFSSAKINLAPFNKIFCCLLYGNNETPAMTLEIANDVCGRGSVRPRFSDVVRQLFRVANTSGKSNTQGASFTCKLFGRVLVVVTRRWLASWRDLSRWVVCRAKKRNAEQHPACSAFRVVVAIRQTSTTPLSFVRTSWYAYFGALLVPSLRTRVAPAFGAYLTPSSSTHADE